MPTRFLPANMKTLLVRPCLLAAVRIGLAVGAWLAWPLPSSGHVPVSESVLHPANAAEAWNVLRLCTANTERLLREVRLAEVPDQISLCNPALRLLPAFVPDFTARQTVLAGTIRTSVTITTLSQAASAGDRDLAARSLATLRADLHALAASFPPTAVNAEVYVCPMHPDFVGADPTVRCARCGMALLPRRIPYSFVYTAPGQPTLRLSASTAAPLLAGQPARVTIHLAHADHTPVLLSDLLVVHTQPIHLLIVDPALGDYHHEHPVPTEVPGDYTFTFTPATSGPYRLFADLVPVATALQEYPCTDLPGPVPFVARVVDKAPTTNTVAGDLHLRLTWGTPDAEPPRANQAQVLVITITSQDGQPMTHLEPVMAAFAHLVGFYDDGATVVHLHPAGAEATDENLRGGPTLSFKFYPPKAGFLRLYCQVQVEGRQIFAPFNVQIAP